MKCNKCNTDYDLVDGICLMKNCLIWKDGSCIICKSGYNYQLGNCVQAKSLLTQWYLIYFCYKSKSIKIKKYAF